MANKVSTVKIVDTRIEPQPPPVYATTVGPLQNQWYSIPASGLSDSFITFNNLTTLGTSRAYLDTMELLITAEITFTSKSLADLGLSSGAGFGKILDDRGAAIPARHMWTFDSFPFNKVCEEVRVNVNGGAFFSSPLSYLTAKERYWDEKKIAESYGGVCPCHKACMSNEVGLKPSFGAITGNTPVTTAIGTGWSIPSVVNHVVSNGDVPCRSIQPDPYMKTASGVNTSMNNSFVPEYAGTHTPERSVTVEVTWREPIFASPFSSKIDATYGRPLYNITSLDIACNMMDLRNMLRVVDPLVASYSVHFKAISLCYQVETVPDGIAPPMTVTPYRRFVPYITDMTKNVDANRKIHMKSGVYTLNEVPTAIWVFAAPTKAQYQTYHSETFSPSTGGSVTIPMSFNKTFGFIENISITLANTTQILSTATPADLYRICKANGLQDSFEDWAMNKTVRDVPGKRLTFRMDNASTEISEYYPFKELENDEYCNRVGSVLRLIPGTDLVIPDQPLIPGANANNLVLNLEADFVMPVVPPEYENKFALWIVFEYVGVATITPGQCEITMNPLGNGAAMVNAPVVSATTLEEPSTTEGSGFFEKVGDFFKKAWNFAKENKIVSNIGRVASLIPHPIAQGIGQAASQVGNALGMGAVKRPRLTGGATMGLGDFI